MENENIKNNLIAALETIVELTANITEEKGNIAQIDIDLLLEQTRGFYLEIINFSNLNKQTANSCNNGSYAEKIIANEDTMIHTIYISQTQQDETQIFAQNTKNNDIYAGNEKPAQTQETIALSADILATNTANIQSEVCADAKKNYSTTIADKFQKADNSLNNQLANNSNRNHILTEAPISNLRSAIGINDKFMFVNDLFRGDVSSFDNSIEQINIAQNKEQAFSILDEKLRNNETNDKIDIRKKLENFINRRFA